MDYNEFDKTPEENIDTQPQPQENNPFRAPDAIESPDFMPGTQQQERLYRGDGVGRKETFEQAPFAGAPYQRVVPPAQEPPRAGGSDAMPWSVPPVKPEPVVDAVPEPQLKASGKKSWLTVLISAGTAAAVAVGVCTLMIGGVNNYWKEQTTLLTQSYEEKLNVAKDELRADIEKNKGSVPATPDTTVPNTQPSERVSGDEKPVTKPPVQAVPSTGADLTPAQVYAQCVNSVVAINCTGTVNGYGQSMQTSSSGSGFILTEDGYVVTNFHVVEGQSKLEVVAYDGTVYQAAYIGGNEANDIALIKVEATGLTPVEIGISSDLVVGEQVAAIGNPLGELASTLTVGYISAKDHIVATDGTQINMLQTDAAINPGNSGGPLFNMRGQVIGITSAKYSGTTDSGASIEGIGFAIPMDDVLGMLTDLQEHGYITGGYLGITASDVDPQAVSLYGLPKGVLVHEVTGGSCAEKAGMKAQDIIINLGGHDIGGMNDLSRALNKFKAGETITVTVYRSGVQEVLSVTLDERPRELSDATTNETPDTQQTNPSRPSVDDSFEDWFDYFIP